MSYLEHECDKHDISDSLYGYDDTLYYVFKTFGSIDGTKRTQHTQHTEKVDDYIVELVVMIILNFLNKSSLMCLKLTEES